MIQLSDYTFAAYHGGNLQIGAAGLVLCGLVPRAVHVWKPHEN